jgi:hypothetical protein
VFKINLEIFHRKSNFFHIILKQLFKNKGKYACGIHKIDFQGNKIDCKKNLCFRIFVRQFNSKKQLPLRRKDIMFIFGAGFSWFSMNRYLIKYTL